MSISDNAVVSQLSLWTESPSRPATRVRHSDRARRVAVRITSAGAVELVVPRGVSEKRAWAFLESRSAWVSHHVERRRALATPGESFPPTAITLPLTGETWRVFQAGGAGALRLRAVGKLLELRGTGTQEQLRGCQQRCLAKQAESILAPALEAVAREHGFQYSALRVRCQRTRWGSCSSRGVISLNLALLFQGPDVVRYLLCHELAHTRHMNHSARFWECVAECEPRWRELDAALCNGWRNVPSWVRGQA